MLKDIARSVWSNAYAPYSKFKVGVAIKTIDGSIFSGVNVENAAYPEGTCAEAAAIAAMCATGQREIVEVYVIADCKEPVPPCGGCRQKLAEFSKPDVPVTMATISGKEKTTSVRDLLPGSFSNDFFSEI
ncbi:MAG: cytidine deaminase [Paracoccaceae bacterium]